MQDLRPPITANTGPEDPEEAKKREAEELRRIKKDKRKEASERAKQKEVAWREELARIELLRKNTPQQTSDEINAAPAQPLQLDEVPAVETTGDTTTSDSARHTPPTVSQPPRDDIQLRIQQYQDRRLLEEKEKDERIAKENARREERLLAEARVRWENERLAKEEERAEAVRQSAVAVHEIRMQQAKAQHAEKANVERQQQVDEIARRAREQEQAMKEQAGLEQVRRTQIQDRIRLEQEQVRRDQQLRDQMAGLEEARRQQALFAQRQQAQREEEQARREQAIRERNQREQAERERAQLELARHEQAQREQAQREQAQREQAQREQAAQQRQLARERAQREQAEEQKRRDLAQLALERARREQAQREQAEEQKRRDLALAQAKLARERELAQRQQQIARERAQREQAEEQKRWEAAQAQALAQEQARRAQAEELLRRQTERAAAEAAEKLAQQNTMRAESLLSQAQSFQHRSSFSDYQADQQYQESPPVQSIWIPPSADILSSSGVEAFPGQRNLPNPQASSQLVNSNVMMELQSAMISVQSQIIATQSKLYGLQNELNGPERSILKHVQHNLLTEQLQSMVSMYNKIQLQLASRQQPPPQQTQRPAPTQYAQEPAYASQQSHATHQHIPNQPRPQQVVRPPFQSQQAFAAPPARPPQQFRPQQASACQPMRPDTQASASRGSFSNGNSGMSSTHQADSHTAKQIFINGQRTNFMTRQPSADSPTGQNQASMPPFHPPPAQPPVPRQDNPPSAQQARPHAVQDASVPLMRGGQPEQPSLMSLYPKPRLSSRTDKQSQSSASPVQNNDNLARVTPPSTIPSTSHAQSKAPPAQNAMQTLPQQTTAERPSLPEESNMQLVTHSKMQDYLESHSLAAKAQLLKAQQLQQMQLAQMARPPMGMGGLSGAMLMDGLQPAQGVSNVSSALDTRSVPSSLVPAPMAMPSPFDPFTPGAMDSPPFLIGDVNGIVPLPAASEDTASRFTEILESPNGKTATQSTSDMARKSASSSQDPVTVTQSTSSSNNNVQASPDPASVTYGTSTASTAQASTTPAISAPPVESVQQALPEAIAPPSETPRPSGLDVSATSVATGHSAKPLSPSAGSSIPPVVQVAVVEEPPHPAITATMAQAPTQVAETVLEPTAEVVDNTTSLTRQRSESDDEQAVRERPTKRRRTDQVRVFGNPDMHGAHVYLACCMFICLTVPLHASS